MSSTHTNLLYHVVFSTKERRPLITPPLRDELYAYLGGIIRGERGVLLEVGGMPDHIHLAARFHQDAAVATMVRLIKANSSKWINQRRTGAGRFRWQRGYGAFSVSESQLARVRRYIGDQASHHRKTTFQEEYIALLKRHRIDYDERYVWD
jgi:putative transposase